MGQPDPERFGITMKKTAKFRKEVSQTQLILFVALFLTTTGNFAFFTNIADVFPWNSGNAGFLLSMVVLLVSVQALFMALFSLVFPVRVVVSVFILLASPIGYASNQFGAVIDTLMIQNILQTDAHEVSDLLNTGFQLRVLLLGIIPVIGVWKFPVKPASWKHKVLSGLGVIGAALAVLMISFVSFGAQYASFIRDHKRLRYYANPVFAIYSAADYWLENISGTNVAALNPVLPNARIAHADGRRKLIIMVVGEAARVDRFSLNGYERATNPYLAMENRIISYTRITACGTSTAVSVPCIFAPQGRREFDENVATTTENLLDVLDRVGINVLWRDNNSGSKDVATRIRFEAFNSPEVNPDCDVECRDIGMLRGLQEYIDTQEGDILVVLHQMGNHGPAYFKRYPAEYEKFTPACHSEELSLCSQAEISNAYDNAILYTDFFLSKVIALLKANTPRFGTAMFYVSDHGESLGEKGAYLHGWPYMFAPAEQIDVPLILWIGETSNIDFASALALKDQASSHDAIFNSLLLAFDITDKLPRMPRTLFELDEDRERPPSPNIGTGISSLH